ncbi:MAG: HdeD family acid-resistance protein [Rhodomicrobium sp.]|nr:HdeD family acid-resistance protein [Rhodomicrobium sp.]
MSTASSDLNTALKHEREVIHDHWVLFLIQGVILAALGLLAIGAPLVATVAVVKMAGWLFIIGGIVGLASFFTGRDVPGSIWSFFAAALAILAGIYLLRQPLAGMLSLTLVLAAFFVAQGATNIVAAFAHSRVLKSWGWVLLNGIVDLFLAGVVLSGWPETSAWVLGLLVGINLFVYGISLIMTAIASRTVTSETAAMHQA